MITLFQQAWAVFWVTVKRLSTQRGFAIATVIGLIISVSLTLSIPLFADATQFRILRSQIINEKGPADYAPLKFLYEFAGKRHNGPQWSDVNNVDQFLTHQAGPVLGIPQRLIVRRFRSDSFQLYPPLDPNNPNSKYFITWVNLGFISTPDKTIRIVEGSYPKETDDSSPIEVMVNMALVDQYGLQVGETYYPRRDDQELPVVIAGVWTAVDPKALYWDTNAEQTLLVSEETYAKRISPKIDDEMLSSAWYLVSDGSKLHASDIGPLVEQIQAIAGRAELLLPGTKLTASPLEALQQYQKEAPSLTLLLYAFSIPILGLLLAFVGLVAGLYVNEQRNEIAVLRSRGATSGQVTGIAALQGLILGVAAMAIGTPLGILLAHMIGWARSFMNFSAPAKLRVSLTPQIIIYGLAAIIIVLLIQVVVPTLTAARKTIVTYKQERARSVQAPGWQRAFLDFILLIPTGYGIFLLERQGSLAAKGTAVPDPLQNPLLLLVPALGIFAVTLLILRIVPTIMAFIAWLASRTNSVGLMMAARYLSRTPAFYSAPLILLVLTLSLSAFTASLAQTLDHQLTRQVYYENGSDLNLLELGTTVNMSGNTPVYTFNPVEDHLRVKDVQAATRVGRYAATALRASGAAAEGVFLGIDRQTFPRAAYWQRNFAEQSLGNLMNSLAQYPDGVLVSSNYMKAEKLKIGDPITLGIKTGDSVGATLRIVGTFDLFPTWYPESGPLFVGNLDYLYQKAGSEYPHEVWLKTAPNTDVNLMVATVKGFSALFDPEVDFEKIITNGLNTQVKEWSSASLKITAEQRVPERQGLFGLLSVGFLTSAILTVMGFMLYTLFSFRRRFIELGMLRAIGLSSAQMIVLLASELIFLVGIGIGVGTALGISVSRWFIPFLQVGASTSAHYPPFIVEIAWSSIVQIYILFGLLFLAGLSVLAALLLRMKVFQAVKLGETT